MRFRRVIVRRKLESYLGFIGSEYNKRLVALACGFYSCKSIYGVLKIFIGVNFIVGICRLFILASVGIEVGTKHKCCDCVIIFNFDWSVLLRFNFL
uniref:Uncharacterized protein n=1 Tax=Pararge aegeria TaxID=116150 RepID=S4NTL9_9NEOP